MPTILMAASSTWGTLCQWLHSSGPRPACRLPGLETSLPSSPKCFRSSQCHFPALGTQTLACLRWPTRQSTHLPGRYLVDPDNLGPAGTRSDPGCWLNLKAALSYRTPREPLCAWHVAPCLQIPFGAPRDGSPGLLTHSLPVSATDPSPISLPESFGPAQPPFCFVSAAASGLRRAINPRCCRLTPL
jgi:hypothetical protein